MKTAMKYLWASGVALVLLTVVSCSDDDKKLPKIDGYNNSDEVAAENLLANWKFDGSNEEDISGTMPLAGGAGTFGTVGFEDGKIGQALKLTQGALVYPGIAAINTQNALNNFTVSMWVYVKNNKGTASEGFTSFFGIFPDTGGDFLWGNIALTAETSWIAPIVAADTLVLSGHYVSKNLDVNSRQDNRPDPKGSPPVGVFKGAGKWTHFVMRWNATDHQLNIFGDGTSIGAYNDRGAAGILLMNTPSKIIFGSLSTQELGFAGNETRPSWHPMATASIDDVRVFNTALTLLEIKALYNLGTAGR